MLLFFQQIAWIIEKSLTPLIFVGFTAAIAVFASRTFAKAFIEKRIEHKFASSLEELKGELRNREERLKSELRRGEAQLAGLQGSLLASRTGRLSLADERRIEAVSALLDAVEKLRPLKNAAAYLAALRLVKFSELSKREPRAQKLMDSLLPADNVMKAIAANRPFKERPFVSPLAWAYFSAIEGICFYYYAYGKMIGIGLDNPEDLVDAAPIKKFIKVALPHISDQVDDISPNAYCHYLDILETMLVEELRSNIEGPAIDQGRYEQTAAIISAAKEVSEKTQKSEVDLAVESLKHSVASERAP